MEKRVSYYFTLDESYPKVIVRNKIFIRCKAQCSESANYTFDVNSENDPKPSKYIFQVNSTKHEDHDTGLYPKLRKYQEGLPDDEFKFIEKLGLAINSIRTAILAVHENSLGIYFEKYLVRRVMRKARDEGNLTENINMCCLVKC
eukprot:snap_masked-scaffold_5-processed-gene-4.12-mRNA-1 protein AED:1.00 eAED:1.00 QI:0/-1/0/0/-1/1/1/0/144